MLNGKYRKDYEISEHTDAHGKSRKSIEYIGEKRIFADSGAANQRRLAFALCIVVLAAFICALIPDGAGMRKIYIALPFVFSILPAALITDAIVNTAFHFDALKRNQYEKLENRYPAASIFIMILPLVSLVGEIINIFAGMDVRTGDIVFCVCASIMIIAGFLLFKSRKYFETKKEQS